MKKIAIPAILVGVMLVAVGFAIQPVEKASAVHTTIQSTQATTFVVTSADIVFTAAGAKTATLDCTSDCVVTSILGRTTAAITYATTDNGGVTQITVDTVAIFGPALVDPVNDANADSATASRDLVITAALADNSAVEYVNPSFVAFGNANAIGAVAAGTNDVRVTVTQVTATDNTYTITFVVQQQGTTAPTVTVA